MAYGVTFDIGYQPTHDRVQIALRIVIVIVLSILAGALGWIAGALYIGIPVVAAILISQKGAATYLAESEKNMTLWLRYIVGFYAYLGILTDKLPSNEQHVVRFEVAPSGEPTVGGVLVRIITAIPHAIVLAILGIVAGILLLIAAIMVLVQESYPEGIFNFLRGYVRWHARLFAYLAGLVQEYPPFALDTGPEAPAPSAPPAPEGPQPQAP